MYLLWFSDERILAILMSITEQASPSLKTAQFDWYSVAEGRNDDTEKQNQEPCFKPT